ncbi:uncharacterized protein FTOL_12941 [Fusarium torulosum]|uniref:Uncharacterized protein n=1 Tax=Fusarium torulosum TaxID=33205 RepID=A0AAE8MLW6_9HYPO|nr:uncharacterized protein FTOL_12941 [Fusarium torulosum]
MGLPLGYLKASYSWSLNYKQMGKCYTTSMGLKADRIEAQIAKETKNRRLFTNRRGIGEL